METQTFTQFAKPQASGRQGRQGRRLGPNSSAVDSTRAGKTLLCPRGSLQRVRAYSSELPGYLDNKQRSMLDLWAEGIADCEATSCGTVPDGSVVLVPFGRQPVKREERIAALESGVQLSEDTATFIGAVKGRGVNFLVDSPVVSAKHARIEGVIEEVPGLFGNLAGARIEVKYFMTDLNSTNGTFLNRGRMRPFFPVEIRPGDVVAFGSLDNAYRVVKAQARRGFVW